MLVVVDKDVVAEVDVVVVEVDIAVVVFDIMVDVLVEVLLLQANADMSNTAIRIIPRMFLTTFLPIMISPSEFFI